MAKDKDVNVHIYGEGAEQTGQQFKTLAEQMGYFGEAAEGAAQKTEEAGRQQEQAGRKSGVLSGILSNLKSQILGIGTAWLSWQGVQRALDAWIKRLETIVGLMKEFHSRAIALQEVGQSLEFQTGTAGRQRQWAQEAADLQRAGGLRDTGTAGQMMIAGDIAFGGQGGIRNPQVMGLLKTIAPFAGAAGLSGEEVTKLFEFAQTAGVKPNPEAWQNYMAQLQAGFTASKATSFGQFMTGLQKGATPYIASGGSLKEAISLFSGARSVTANEALAGTLLEQITRLSGGAYEKPRQAMEKTMGVRWEDLSMDQRATTLLQYAQQLPENQRAQFLAEAGFPAELINQIGRLVTPGGMETIGATRRKVTGASAAELGELTGAYLQSDVGQQRQVDAEGAGKTLGLGPQFSAWQRRMDRAKQTYEERMVTGTDIPWVRGAVEPSVLALQEIRKEVDDLIASGTLDEEGLRQAQQVRDDITFDLSGMRHFGNQFLYPKARAERLVYEAENQLQGLGSGTVINYNNNTILQEREPAAGPRAEER